MSCEDIVFDYKNIASYNIGYESSRWLGLDFAWELLFSEYHFPRTCYNKCANIWIPFVYS